MNQAPAQDLMSDGEKVLASALAAVPDDGFAAPSLLPGWDRAHVIAHLCGNAQALGRLISWAATGQRTPMYADGGERDRQIEELSALEPAKLRDMCLADSAALLAAWQALPKDKWQAPVQTFHGRGIEVSQVCWMRARESHIHAADLGGPVTFADLDVAFLDPLLDDVTAALGAKSGQEVTLRDPSRMRDWIISPQGTSGQAGTAGRDRAPVTVTGPTYALAKWATGRGSDPALASSAGHLPQLPAWL